MKLHDLKSQHTAALDQAESFLTAAEKVGRTTLHPWEKAGMDNALAEANALATQIQTSERTNTLRTQMGPDGMLVPGVSGGNGRLSPDYRDAFMHYVQSAGRKLDAALYEGSDGAGGFVLPTFTDQNIVPLAPPEMALMSIALVIPTSSDVKVPQKGSFSTAALKVESGATAYSFTESDPTLTQFTLSAFMSGNLEKLSWELAQDVTAFQAFAVSDLITGVQILEESLFVSGTGTGQAQGLLGNVGAGVTEEPDASGNLVSITGTLDLVGSLKEAYHANASWLMTRATSIIIRKAQTQANLFAPAWTREGGQDFLHGYPVNYSSSMPTAARSATPVLFGDFKQGYVIGVRGGTGINVKVLDQTFAVSGQIGLIGYRRLDGRVRRSEAIQSYNIAAS